ncbi:MAG: NAD(P)-dependent oxidoreductase [Gemmatimonadota bacterium]
MTILILFLLYAVALWAALARRGVPSGKATPAEPPAETPPEPSAEPGTGPAGTSPSRILIVGATGGTGRQLVAQALKRGHSVTALVRDPSKLQLEHSRLRVLRGDVLDYASVEAAVSGQDAVISALGHKRYFYPTRILSDGTRNILRAMEAHGVHRLVCQTSLGIGDSAGRMGLYYTFLVIPFVVPLYFWDKTRQERLIAESQADWVIVRPGKLTNAEARGRYRHGSRVGNFIGTVRISRADVADFMLNQLTDDTYLRAAPGVAG